MYGSRNILVPVAGLIAVALLLVVSIAQIPPAVAQETTTLAIDAEPAENSATLLGPRTVCIAVQEGQTFDVDITIDNVVDLSAWDAYLGFDDSVVNVIDRDVQQFMVSTPDGNAFDLSESVPDDGSPYRIGAADLSDPPTGVSGSGVLARLTLEAVGPGVTDLTLQPQATGFEGQQIGPTLTDVNANGIGDSDGDSFFDGPTLDARVAVNGDCSGTSGPTALLPGNDGGIPWWVFAAGSVGIVLAAGIGGVALIVLRRRPRQTA